MRSSSLRALALVGLCLGLSTSASAAEPAGTGRITLLPGYRYTPNDFFRKRAAAAGLVLGAPSPGGPQISASFGYRPSDAIEVGIDLLGGGEQLEVPGFKPLSSVTYGALLGPRFFLPVSDRLDLIAGVFTGGVLVYLSGGQLTEPSESFLQTYGGLVGVTFKFSESFAATAEAKLLLARGIYPEVGGFNGGGLWAGVGLTYVFPPEDGPFSGK